MSKHTETLSQIAIADTCPVCSSNKIDYGETNWADGDQEYQECICGNCGCEFNQWYTLVFVGQDVDKTEIPAATNERDKLKEINKELLAACKCALADLEGIMPELEPSGDRQLPGWETIKELRATIAKAEKE